MNIIQVSASFTETCSLPNYNNVKPGVTITATLEPEESAIDALRQLMVDARCEVRELINQAQESAGQTPKYWDGPLYRVERSCRREMVIVVESLTQTPDDFSVVFYSPLRFDAAMAIAAGLAEKHKFALYDCSDGDFDKLPPLPEPDDGDEAQREYEAEPDYPDEDDSGED